MELKAQLVFDTFTLLVEQVKPARVVSVVSLNVHRDNVLIEYQNESHS